MGQKKLPNEIGLDSLLNALENNKVASDGVDDAVLDSDVPVFLIKNNIKSGDNITTGDFLYRLYKLFSNSPVSKLKFIREISLYIHRQTGYYLINKEPSELFSDLSHLTKARIRPRTASKSSKLHFDSFIKENEIEVGKSWLEDYVLYHFYDKWTFDSKKNRMLRLEVFRAFMKIFFENKTTKDGSVFRINHKFDTDSIGNIKTAWKKRKQKEPK